MTTLRTKMVSALTLGALTVTFAGDALANHDKGRGYGKGRGPKTIEVYVDADGNRALEQMIIQNLERQNRFINVVPNKRYADVVVRVDGRLSEPYRAGGRYHRGLAAMDYDYTIKVRSGGRTIYKDRIRGQVTEPEGRYRNGNGYHYNSYSKGELARDVFGILVEVIAERRGDGYGGRYRIEEELAYEAFQEVANRVAQVKLRPGYGRYR